MCGCCTSLRGLLQIRVPTPPASPPPWSLRHPPAARPLGGGFDSPALPYSEDGALSGISLLHGEAQVWAGGGTKINCPPGARGRMSSAVHSLLFLQPPKLTHTCAPTHPRTQPLAPSRLVFSLSATLHQPLLRQLAQREPSSWVCSDISPSAYGPLTPFPLTPDCSVLTPLLISRLTD